MKPTTFSMHVTNFLMHYLAAQRNLSPNTIKAYRDVFTLLLRFCRDVRGIVTAVSLLIRIDRPQLSVKIIVMIAIGMRPGLVDASSNVSHLLYISSLMSRN